MSDDLLPVTIDDMIAEVRRELAMRDRLYERWKSNTGRSKRYQLDHQYRVMAAILKHLEGERGA